MNTVNTLTKVDITHDAADPSFNYYGRWDVGSEAISINSGSLVEYAYTGDSCTLFFDVTEFTYYPAIFVQVDEGPVAKTTLSREISSIKVNPLCNTLPGENPPFSVVSSGHHVVRFWIACHSLYQTNAAGKQWTTLVGGCRFLGVNLKGGNLVSLPYCSKQIEFLGDSITQGLRLLYTGSDDDIGQQNPPVNWPQYVATLLGMKPVVTGFGGQGLSVSGTSGVPPVEAAFPFIYDQVKWNLFVKPKIVVIYHGTNDSVSPLVFKDLYVSCLATVRKAYPSAVIFAICPYNKTNYVEAIQQAVNKLYDDKILFLNYSSVISTKETCDGCHLNPGGAVKLAIRLAKDLKNATGEN